MAQLACINAPPTLTHWRRLSTQDWKIDLGEKNQGPIPAQRAKYKNVLPYGSRSGDRRSLARRRLIMRKDYYKRCRHRTHCAYTASLLGPNYWWSKTRSYFISYSKLHYLERMLCCTAGDFLKKRTHWRSAHPALSSHSVHFLASNKYNSIAITMIINQVRTRDAFKHLADAITWGDSHKLYLHIIHSYSWRCICSAIRNSCKQKQQLASTESWDP